MATHSPQVAPPAEISALLRPRWGAVGVYLVALALSRAGLVQSFSAWPILGVAAITAVTNLIVPRVYAESRAVGLTSALLVFDVCLLSGALYLTGGAENPLSALYVVPIALAAVMLPARWAWVLVVVTVSAYGMLFFSPRVNAPLPSGHEAHAGALHEHFGLHLRGMWVAYALTAVSVAYFVTRVSESLAKRERELARARDRAMRAERVASLASLAASTAHELGTPIASMSLAASEMERASQRGVAASELQSDIALVKTQATRCREILDSMLAEAGETVGEAPVEVSARAVVEDALATLPAGERDRVRCVLPDDLPRLRLPRKIVAQAVFNLVRNALDASRHDSAVELTVSTPNGRVRFGVTDHGVGMTPDELEDAMVPFASSKVGPGRGLGLFLTRAVAQRLGGELVLRSREGEGTQAELELARDVTSTG